jgi:hypothetical protein
LKRIAVDCPFLRGFAAPDVRKGSAFPAGGCYVNRGSAAVEQKAATRRNNLASGEAQRNPGFGN